MPDETKKIKENVKLVGFASSPAVAFQGIDKSLYQHPDFDILRKIQWTELLLTAQKNDLDVPEKSVVIIHAGALRNLELWLEWAANNHSWGGIIFVSTEPGGKLLDRFIKSKEKHRFNKDNEPVFLYPSRIVAYDRDVLDEDIRKREFRNFCKLLNVIPKIDTITVDSYREKFAKEIGSKLRVFLPTNSEEQKKLFRTSTMLMLQECVNIALAREVAVNLQYGYDGYDKDDAFEDFELAEQGIEFEAKPFYAARLRLNHTLLKNEVLSMLIAARDSSENKHEDENEYIQQAIQDWETARGILECLIANASLFASNDPVNRSISYFLMREYFYDVDENMLNFNGYTDIQNLENMAKNRRREHNLANEPLSHIVTMENAIRQVDIAFSDISNNIPAVIECVQKLSKVVSDLKLCTKDA